MNLSLLQKMKSNKMAIGAVALLLVAIVGLTNRYAIVEDASPIAAGIWVLDRFTGSVEYCSPGGGCTKVSETE